ncbi:MAG: DNA polymerase III subunit delta [Crocinitomicaceae bacterium]
MALNHIQLIKQAKEKKFAQIYLLHGEEAYFIDLIADAILENALEEHERDFNLTVVYGKDADAGQIIAEAKSYPTMAERRVVIMREAQSFGKFDDLLPYFQNPNPQTVFVICHKYKTLDARGSAAKAIAKNGLVFKSEKVKDYKLAEYIMGMARNMGYTLSQKAAILLAEFLGTDLSKVQGELDKLALLVEKGSTINEVHIEENIGISKDFNVYELTNAVAIRDVPKAFQIVHYFEHQPKSGPLVMVISNMFAMFSRLMRMHFMNGSSDEEMARKLGLHPFALKQSKPSLKIYPPRKISANIATLHEYDLKSKGLGNSSFPEGELMRELIFKLMH